MSNQLSIYYQNCRGLRTKTNQFFLSSLISHYDIIVATESWLNPNIHNNELLDTSKYNVYRKDRCEGISEKLDGGGVFVAVSNDLKSVEVQELSCNNLCEDIWVSIQLPGNIKLFICCVYIPPYCNINNFAAFFNKITSSLEVNNNDMMLILGDFNLPKFTWVFNSTSNIFSQDFVNDEIYFNFSETLSYNNLYQFNGCYNANNKILDLVLSNSKDVQVTKCDSPFVNEDIHHHALDIYFQLPELIRVEKASYSSLNFFKANYNEICSKLDLIEWDLILQPNNTEEATIKFYDILRKTIEDHVPRINHSNNKGHNWISARTKKKLKEKHNLFRKWKKYNRLGDYDNFSVARRECKNMIKNDYKNYINHVENSIIENPKKFWAFVSNKKKSSNIPNSMTLDNEKFEGPTEVVKAFSSFFSSVYEKSEKNPILKADQEAYNNTAININFIPRESILKKIENLDIRKGAGPDEIPPIFVKSCGKFLLEPLFILYNKSLTEGTFPSSWKIAKSVPIFKSGKRNDITNYRSVSILCVFGKMLESIITDDLFFMSKNLLSTKQHGFYKTRSTLSNLVPFVQFLADSMDNRVQVDAVYTDFSKAFDKVHHETLFIKLSDFGVHGNLLAWIKSYLTNRSQYIVVNNCQSDLMKITSGVPQGSHIGPLLFSIFINDVSRCFLHCDYLLYADDLKLYKQIYSPADVEAFQADLNRLESYCKENYLFLNANKCNHIMFSRNRVIFDNIFNIGDNVVQKVTTIKDLGVTLDVKLSFEAHIDNIVNKAFKMLGFILRSTKDFKDLKCVMILYFTLVRSVVEYNSVVWYPFYAKYIDRIERVQIKFIRNITYRFNKDMVHLNYLTCITHYKMLTLKERRDMFDCLFVYKVLNGIIDTDLMGYLYFLIPNYSIRNNCLFSIQSSHSNANIYSPLNRIQRFFNNNLSNQVDIFNIRLNVFKTHVINYLRSLRSDVI